jgi:hypothetical protein
MSQKKPEKTTVELTPLEKIESLYSELVDWYGEADKKEQRVAAKLLIVALEKIAIFEGNGWDDLVMEYVAILKNDPERFQKIIESNRGDLKAKKATTLVH